MAKSILQIAGVKFRNGTSKKMQREFGGLINACVMCIVRHHPEDDMKSLAKQYIVVAGDAIRALRSDVIGGQDEITRAVELGYNRLDMEQINVYNMNPKYVYAEICKYLHKLRKYYNDDLDSMLS